MTESYTLILATICFIVICRHHAVFYCLYDDLISLNFLICKTNVMNEKHCIKFPRAAETKCHKLCGLKEQKLIVSVLEIRSQKSRYRQGHGPSEI